MSYLWWLRPQTWRALWIAVRRFPRDKRARINVLRLLLSFAIVAVWAVFNFYYFRGIFTNFSRTGALILSLVGFTFVLIFIVSKVGQRRERRAQERASPSVAPDLKRLLFREACLLGILLERFASETYFEKEIPPNIVITTRRVLLDRLSELGLREDLEPALLDLLLAPDGHWTPEQKHRAAPALECLAVLR